MERQYSGQEWAMPSIVYSCPLLYIVFPIMLAQLGQLKTGLDMVVVKSTVLPQQSCKVMGVD